MNDSRTNEEKAIMARIGELNTELQRQHQLLDEERMKRAGVEIGQIVVRRGEEYQVCEIEPPSYGKAWIKGHPKKKDGTFGKAVRSLYSDWKLVEAA